MKKRLLAILVAVAMIVCSMATMSFAAETKTATFTFSAETDDQVTYQDGKNRLHLTSQDVTLDMEDECDISWYTSDYEEGSGLWVDGLNSLTKITVPEGMKITGVFFSLGCDYKNYYTYYGWQTYYDKDEPTAPASEAYNNHTNDFITKANGTQVNLICDKTNNVEYYTPADTDNVTEFTIERAIGDMGPYLRSITVTYESTGTPVTPTKAGANTGDSNDIALFGIMGILALCGAGFVYKRREN